MTGRRAGQPPGVLLVRLSGERADRDALAAILAAHPQVQVLAASGPRPNRYEPGGRVYLTLRITRRRPPMHPLTGGTS